MQPTLNQDWISLGTMRCVSDPMFRNQDFLARFGDDVLNADEYVEQLIEDDDAVQQTFPEPDIQMLGTHYCKRFLFNQRQNLE